MKTIGDYSINVVMYHYVRPIKNSKYPNIKGLEFEDFKKQIDFFLNKFNIISHENFIEDTDNEGYLPLKINIRENEKLAPKEFFVTKVSVPLLNSANYERQMLTAGAVAYFSNTKAAIDLLNRWLENIKHFPRAVDDLSLIHI